MRPSIGRGKYHPVHLSSSLASASAVKCYPSPHQRSRCNKTRRKLKLARINLNPPWVKSKRPPTSNCAPTAAPAERLLVDWDYVNVLLCNVSPGLSVVGAAYTGLTPGTAKSKEKLRLLRRERPRTNEEGQENCAKSRPGFCEGPMHHDRIASLSKIIIKSNLKSFRQWTLQSSSAVQTDRRPGNCTLLM